MCIYRKAAHTIYWKLPFKIVSLRVGWLLFVSCRLFFSLLSVSSISLFLACFNVLFTLWFIHYMCESCCCFRFLSFFQNDSVSGIIIIEETANKSRLYNSRCTLQKYSTIVLFYSVRVFSVSLSLSVCFVSLFVQLYYIYIDRICVQVMI